VDDVVRTFDAAAFIPVNARGCRFGCHLVPFVWLQVSRLRLQNLRRSVDVGSGSSYERCCLLLLALSATASLGLCSFGWAATQ
jgi:hypothetical protein